MLRISENSALEAEAMAAPLLKMPWTSVTARVVSTVATLVEMGSKTGSGVPSGKEWTGTTLNGNRPSPRVAALMFDRWMEFARK